MATAAIVLFVIAGLGGTYRLLAGPSLADRIIALDVLLISFMCALAVNAADTGNTNNLIMLVVLAIIGFTATVAAARFLQYEHTQPGQATSPKDISS